MPFNGTGTYVLPTGQPVVAGTEVSSSVFNTYTADVAQTFDNCLPRDGQAPMSGSLLLMDGSDIQPAIAFNAEASTGLLRPAPGTVALSVLGVEAFRAVGGRMLMGTTTDDGTTRLQVTGNAHITGTLTAGAISASATTGPASFTGEVDITLPSTGRLVVDSTGYTPTVASPQGVVFKNTNVYNNTTDPYGSGGWLFDRSAAIDNNQVSLSIFTNVSTTSNGNTAWLEMQNQAGQISKNPNFLAAKTIGGSAEMTAVNYSVGALNTVGAITGGTGYTDGTYTNVPLTTTGRGIGALATVTVSGGSVISVAVNGSPAGGGSTFQTGGSGAIYALGDSLSCNASSIGGTGSGFATTVQYVSPYNGKLKLGVTSGCSQSSTVAADGYVYLGTRKTALSGAANTAFEEAFRFYPLSAQGQGWMQMDGSGLAVQPVYNFGTDAKISVVNPFGNSQIVSSATSSGMASTITSQSTLGSASVIAQTSDTHTASFIARSNWTATGTGQAMLQLLTDFSSGTSGWNVYTAGTGSATPGSLIFGALTAGVNNTVLTYNASSSSLSLVNNANPELKLTSNTATTGRNFSISSVGSTSQLRFYDVTNSQPLGYFQSSDAGGKLNLLYGLVTPAITSTGAITSTAFVPSSATIPTNGLYLPAANTVGLAYNSTKGLVIDSQGALVLGTSYSPVAAGGSISGAWSFGGSTVLDNVNGAIGFNTYFDNVAASWKGTRAGYGFLIRNNNDGSLRVYQQGAVTAGTAAVNTQVLQIDSTGLNLSNSGGLKTAGHISRYQSTNQTVPSTTGITSVTHGGTRVPDMFAAYWVNVTTEGGYVAGDYVQVTSDPSSVGREVQVTANATSITLNYNGSGVAPGIRDTTGAYLVITPAKWALVFKALWL